MTGRVLGNYRILERIGAGGMGEVYRAQHQRLARLAAVKVLLPEFSAKPELVERFFVEARATSLIRHRGIVEILDCDVQEDGRAFIVMELLEGESLAECLARVRSFGDEPQSAVRVGREIAQALRAAHERGIVHRDLKPDNVYLARSDEADTPVRVKILDFGIAKLLGSASNGVSRTRTGSLIGTPLYMSPEQCRGLGQIDERSDIYSLGCILFQTLTGRPPFEAESSGDLIVAHITQAPPVLRDLDPRLDVGLAALVARMLAKAPEDRPASMREVDEALSALADKGQGASTTLILGPGPRTLAAPPPWSAGTVGLEAVAPVPTSRLGSTTLQSSTGVVEPPARLPGLRARSVEPRPRVPVWAAVAVGAVIVAGAVIWLAAGTGSGAGAGKGAAAPRRAPSVQTTSSEAEGADPEKNEPAEDRPPAAAGETTPTEGDPSAGERAATTRDDAPKGAAEERDETSKKPARGVKKQRRPRGAKSNVTSRDALIDL